MFTFKKKERNIITGDIVSYPSQNPNPVPNQNPAVGTKSDKHLSLDTRRNIPVGFRVTKREEAELQDLANELADEFLTFNPIIVRFKQDDSQVLCLSDEVLTLFNAADIFLLGDHLSINQFLDRYGYSLHKPANRL